MPQSEPPAAGLRQAALVGILVALLVLGLRVAAWLLTRSLAVLADAIDPFFNLLAALVTAGGVLAARRPASEDHPFGYRKLEFVAVGFHGATILAGAVVVVLAGLWQTASGLPLAVTPLAMALFVASVACSLVLSHVLSRAGQTYASPALAAAGRHAWLDVLIGLGVTLNLYVGWRINLPWLDPLVSAVIVAVLARSALRLLRRASHGLLDSAGPGVREQVETAIHSTLDDTVVGFHDIRCRDAGGLFFIDFHLQFAPRTGLEEAHAVATRIEDAVEAAVAHGDATAHLEPHTQVRADRVPAAATDSPRERSRRRAAALSLTVAIVLVVVKLAAYHVTHSAAVLSDALESIVNIVAAGFAVFSIRLARSGSDREHPYGHHKIEFLAAAFEGALILLAGLLIIAAAAPRLVHPVEVSQLDTGLALLLVAALVNGLLGWYLIRAGRHLNSLTLVADGQHVLSDVWTSVGVVGGLAVVRFTHWAVLDPVVAILVALVIVNTGARLVLRSLRGVMDTVDAATLDRAGAVLADFAAAAQIVSWHRLRVRDAGSIRFIDLHVQMPDGCSLATAHDVAEAIEARLQDELAPADAIVHAEPCEERVGDRTP